MKSVSGCLVSRALLNTLFALLLVAAVPVPDGPQPTCFTSLTMSLESYRGAITCIGVVRTRYHSDEEPCRPGGLIPVHVQLAVPDFCSIGPADVFTIERLNLRLDKWLGLARVPLSSMVARPDRLQSSGRATVYSLRIYVRECARYRLRITDDSGTPCHKFEGNYSIKVPHGRWDVLGSRDSPFADNETVLYDTVANQATGRADGKPSGGQYSAEITGDKHILNKNNGKAPRRARDADHTPIAQQGSPSIQPGTRDAQNGCHPPPARGGPSKTAQEEGYTPGTRKSSTNSSASSGSSLDSSLSWPNQAVSWFSSMLRLPLRTKRTQDALAGAGEISSAYEACEEAACCSN